MPDIGLIDGIGTGLIDNFSLLLSHGLILLAAWRLLFRPDLDEEASPNSRDSGDA